MKLFFITMSIILSATSAVCQDNAWLSKLLASKLATRATQNSHTIKRHVTSAPKAKKAAQGLGRDEYDVIDEATHRKWDEANQSRTMILSLLLDQKYEDAYISAKAMAPEDGSFEYEVSDLLAYCALLTNRYREAYDQTVNRIRTKQAAGCEINDSEMLTLSLASALLGQIYNGQGEYCRAATIKGRRSHALIKSDLSKEAVQRQDAKGIAILSSLGLAWNATGPYMLELTLRIDPKNVIAADELVCYYELQNKPGFRTRVAKQMVKNLLPGDKDRERFEKIVEEQK